MPLDAPVATKVPFNAGFVEGRQVAAPHEGTMKSLEIRFVGRENTAGTAAAMTAK